MCLGCSLSNSFSSYQNYFLLEKSEKSFWFHILSWRSAPYTPYLFQTEICMSCSNIFPHFMVQWIQHTMVWVDRWQSVLLQLFTDDLYQLLHSFIVVRPVTNNLENKRHKPLWASAWDFQQYGILTWHCVDSDKPLQPPLKLRHSKWCSVSRILKRPAKALIRLLVCAGWSEALLVAHTTLLIFVDSDEPLQPPFKLRHSKWCSVSSLTIIEHSSDQQRLWSDCVCAQADLRPCWSHIPHCWKSHALAQNFNNVRNLSDKILFKQRLWLWFSRLNFPISYINASPIQKSLDWTPNLPKLEGWILIRWAIHFI